ncbi:MAG: translation initiation factor IF-2 [Candidatus Paceibacterota bacterium]
MTKEISEQKNTLVARPPVIVIMGHIDHGKSTLLDYIRKTNVADKEVGGITQRVSAYEVDITNEAGKEQKITFLDTPGHEAFSKARSYGAKVADVAILIVSAEDGVKPQTIEALEIIQEGKLPYIVAINKIDKPNANLEKTKQTLAEKGVYVEGYGGNVPFVAISAKTGEGVSELLNMILLVADMEEFTADPTVPAEGIVIEAIRDERKGISSTLIIKNGSLKQGMFLISSESLCTARMMENFLGKKITDASVGNVVKVYGWNMLPKIGSTFETFSTKKEAEAKIILNKEQEQKVKTQDSAEIKEEKTIVPVVIKANIAGVIDAIEYELKKIETDKVAIKIVHSGVGVITENDIRITSGKGGKEGTIVIGFDTETDPRALDLAERLGIEIKTFDIIYKLSEWLEEVVKERTPKVATEQMLGRAKILKTFSQNKDKQIIGGRMEEGSITSGADVKILRRDVEISRGKIKELQQQKMKTGEVKEGEFGTMIESKIEIAPGDKIECFEIVNK